MRTSNFLFRERIPGRRNARTPLPGTALGFPLYSWVALTLSLLLCACQTIGKDTIGQLRNARMVIEEEKVENVPEKAMESYRRFLEETPESGLTPEAIRRLADLKAEREYDLLAADAATGQQIPPEAPPPPGSAAQPDGAPTHTPIFLTARNPAGETRADFEKRAAQTAVLPYARADKGLVDGAVDLERIGAYEAIELYQKLLKEYPAYERNDQVLYQLARTYEELGRVDEAVQVMGRLTREQQRSRFVDEMQFRLAEYFFTRRRYVDAEEAYGSIVAMGASSSYYPLALYKMGWAYYKQELYDNALDRFIALLDHQVSTGYDFTQTSDEAERKRMDDTFRVISLSFSNLGGAGSATEYFSRHGKRKYEDSVYGSLAEFYFEKRRYGDAAATYTAFIDSNPFHRESPQFQMRVIEVHLAGGFPSLVIDAKKRFAGAYGITADYWRHFEPANRPEVLAWLKTNQADLARHYHALYQSPKQVKDKSKNFEEALHWYREYLASFPADADSPAVNHKLADLYLENRSFDLAAGEYEKTSYAYPSHERSSQAGYAAIYAWRQHLAGAAPEAKTQVRKEAVRSSLQFAVAYPGHENAPIVLGAAADDLYDMREYAAAAAAAHRLAGRYPRADAELLRQAWLVAGHASYELCRYADAETAYTKLLALLPAGDRSREARTDNLAAAIYKQGEEENAQGNPQAAAVHFLRLGNAAPASRIRVNAEYDGAAALIKTSQWMMASTVLNRFRTLFPGHDLQPEVTRKLAYVYRQQGRLSLAADEYERMEREFTDDTLRQEALLTAAELHEKAGSQGRALAAYRRSVELFPHPLEPNLETRVRIADMLKKGNDQDGYLAELGQIVAVETAAGSERSPRTRAVAAQAALVLAERSFSRFAEAKLVEPFEASLNRKKELMKVASRQFSGLVDYEIGTVTAAAIYYLAEIYAGFSRDLMESERPKGLSAAEQEEYDLALEEQAYPFEEKAIATHQSNLELVLRGVYNEWIDKSLDKLARLVPARYDKPEEESQVIATLDRYVFTIGHTGPAAQAGAKQGPKLGLNSTGGKGAL